MPEGVPHPAAYIYICVCSHIGLALAKSERECVCEMLNLLLQLLAGAPCWVCKADASIPPRPASVKSKAAPKVGQDSFQSVCKRRYVQAHLHDVV